MYKAPLLLLSRSRSGKGSWGSSPDRRCGASAVGCAKAVPAGHMLLGARKRASDGRAAAAQACTNDGMAQDINYVSTPPHNPLL